MSAFIPVAPDRWAEMVQAWVEVGPLRNKVSDLSTQLELRQVEIDRLRAENERLRKAGDAMAHWIDHQHDKDGYPFSEAWEAANKVKKGKSV